MVIFKRNGEESPGAAGSGAVQAAIDHGIDISSLNDNIKRTVAERIKRHQIALASVEKLRRARDDE